MKTITVNCKAWIPNHSLVCPEDLARGQRLTDLSYSAIDMSSIGWTFVGEAVINVDLMDKKTIINNKVDALKKEASAIRAEATAKVTHIESQIQNLLAICYDEDSAAVSKATAS